MKGIPLVNGKAFDPNKCVLCQNVKDKNGDKYLADTDDGRQKLLECSKTLGDQHIYNTIAENFEKVRYHVKSCSSTYVKRATRARERENELAEEARRDDSETNESESGQRSSKRRKLEEASTESGDKRHLCVICNQKKCKGDTTIYRISVKERAIELLQASRYFKDDVNTRCILLQSPGDVFAADVYYHNKCFTAYIIKFKRDIEALLATDFCEDINDNNTKLVINEALDKLDLTGKAYSLSIVCNSINDLLTSKNISKSENFSSKSYHFYMKSFSLIFNL